MATIEPTNPYAAPQAALDVSSPAVGLPANIENAVAGGYDFTVGEVMDEAWRLVKGMKGSFWGAALVIALIYLVFDIILGLASAAFITKGNAVIVKQIHNSVVGALMTPFTMGLQMMCVQRALDQPISFSTAFSYFPRAGTALVGALLVLLMTAVGTVALILPGIYLSIAYQMTIKLICDQGMPAWKAMETSRRALKYKWWSIFGLMLLVGLATGVSALGLLIPLIWTLPWLYMTSAVLYRRIFYAPTPAPAAAAASPFAPPPAGPAVAPS
jgi:hypothetical protein